MEILVEDHQKALKINPLFLEKLVSKTLLHFKTQVDEISIHLVSYEKIQELHAQFFDDPSKTDCITFPIDPPGTEGYCYLGEIFICTEAAVDFCQSTPSQPLGKEIALYVIHGILHLLGYNDLEANDRQVMRLKEEEVLNLFTPKFFKKLID